ncbi:hypothetical protein B0A55_09079 [Friedmanniomyces simplex]|uniref:Uncharacterized protein n=1 Tax=Friedmanniomyces simplex TaxID=329884 RepID=A0A4U0X197_9PEZI|nr:hypothetical protein B0A55_09079 [Friedmanniomyces simplex]
MAPPPQQTNNTAPSALLPRDTPPHGPDLTPDQQRQAQAHDAKRKALSSSAAHFVPMGPFDVTLSSLRMVIFQIDETSATLVAQVIREELNDTQICNLLQGIYISPPDADKRVVRAAALCKKMYQARIQLAKNLRDCGFVDVDVIYQCEDYRVEPFKNDKDKVSGLGGKVYHMYPFRKVEKEMAFSVVVQPWVLEQVYPPQHREEYSISFKTNTAPAPPDVPDPSQASRPNTIFPFQGPSSGALTAMGQVDKIVGIFKTRENTKNPKESLPKVKVTPKRGFAWHLFNSASRADQPQPAWTAETAPFLGVPGVEGNNQWWLDDLAARKPVIDEWEQRTRVPLEHGGFYRSLAVTDAGPETAKAGVDYHVVPPLSGTYTADRNMQWHRDNVEKVMRAEQLREFKDADAAYDAYMLKVQAFYNRYTAVQLNTQYRDAKPQAWQADMEAAQRTERHIQREVQVRGDLVQQMAKVCELRLSLGKFEILGKLEGKMRVAVMTAEPARDVLDLEEDEEVEEEEEEGGVAGPAPRAPSAAAMPDTPIPTTRMLLRQRTATRGNADLAPTRNINTTAANPLPTDPAPSPRPAIIISRTPTPEHQTLPALEPQTTIPFPAYKDPMIAAHQAQEDLAATQQDIRKPSAGLPARTNTAKALTGILVKSGVRWGKQREQEEQEGRVDSARVTTPSLARVRFVLPDEVEGRVSRRGGYGVAGEDEEGRDETFGEEDEGGDGYPG